MNARIEKYLKAYNLVQLTGWMLALLCLPFSFIVSFYTVLVVQVLSLLEILNAWKKWNNSSVLFCFLQITARIMVLFWSYVLMLITIFNVKPIRHFSEVLYVMLAAWCVAEVIRYAYYVTQLFKQENRIITWLRYSAFILCYPAGLLCECFIFWTVFRHNDVLAVKILMAVIAVIYAIYFPKLYGHLLRQRKQKLT